MKKEFLYWLEILGNAAVIAFGLLILVNFAGMWNGGVIRWHEPNQFILIGEMAGVLLIMGMGVFNLVKDINPPVEAGKENAVETKKFWQSKTFWLGVIVCLGGVAEFLAGVEPGASLATVIAGVLTVIVRFLTKTQVTK